jgi:hypothetical protein
MEEIFNFHTQLETGTFEWMKENFKSRTKMVRRNKREFRVYIELRREAESEINTRG